MHTWAVSAVKWSEAMKMLSGNADTNLLRPQDAATRAEIADMLTKALTQIDSLE